MSSVSDGSNMIPTGVSLAERIDAAARRAKVNTTELAKAAGVTWAAAKRWRTGEAEPKPDNLLAIAERCGVTIDELMGIAAGQEPPFPAWRDFLETPEGRSMTDEERPHVASASVPKGRAPTVATYQFALAGVRSAQPR